MDWYLGSFSGDSSILFWYLWWCVSGVLFVFHSPELRLEHEFQELRMFSFFSSRLFMVCYALLNTLISPHFCSKICLWLIHGLRIQAPVTWQSADLKVAVVQIWWYSVWLCGSCFMFLAKLLQRIKLCQSWNPECLFTKDDMAELASSNFWIIYFAPIIYILF